MVYDPSRSVYERRFRQVRADEPPPPPPPAVVPVFVADGHAAAALGEIVRLAAGGGVIVEVDAAEPDLGFMADALRSMSLPPFEAECIRFKPPRPPQAGTTPYEPAPGAAPQAGPAAQDEDEAAFFAELEAEESAKGLDDDGDD